MPEEGPLAAEEGEIQGAQRWGLLGDGVSSGTGQGEPQGPGKVSAWVPKKGGPQCAVEMGIWEPSGSGADGHLDTQAGGTLGAERGGGVE